MVAGDASRPSTTLRRSQITRLSEQIRSPREVYHLGALDSTLSHHPFYMHAVNVDVMGGNLVIPRGLGQLSLYCHRMQ